MIWLVDGRCALVGSIRQRMEPNNDIRNVVRLRADALAIQTESICPHIVEQHVIQAKDENVSRYVCVGLEHTALHENDGLQLLAFHQLLANRFGAIEETSGMPTDTMQAKHGSGHVVAVENGVHVVALRWRAKKMRLCLKPSIAGLRTRRFSQSFGSQINIR